MAARATYLDDILARHRGEAARDDRDLASLVETARACGPARGFAASAPSAGPVGHRGGEAAVPVEGSARATDLDPALLAKAYAEGGAACLSVLTDGKSFGGSPDDLVRARAATDLPVLRKDFTVDARDVCDARSMGADAVLLIAAALSDSELARFHALAHEVGLDALVEVHDEPELERALAVGATLVGVNQRDLVTFEVDHARAVRMAAAIPADVVKVAESGVRGSDDARSLAEAGYDAVLVGEHLVTSTDPSAAIRLLRGE